MQGGTGGSKSRLLSRLLGKLRGDHRYNVLDKRYSTTSSGVSESIGCGSSANEDEDLDAPPLKPNPVVSTPEHTEQTDESSDVENGEASGSPDEAAGVSPCEIAGVSPIEAAGMSPAEAAGMSPAEAAGMSPGEAAGVSPSEAAGVSPGEAASMSPGEAVNDSVPAEMPAVETLIDDTQFAANIDLRYGGQYLSPDQLPDFCDQLHHLVEVIRNIHSYARITGEYPSELERRLEQEAREVASLAAEARNARDVVARARAQRRAVRAQRKQLVAHLASLKETEIRELETSIRLSDRKLFKSWETLKDSSDPAAFEPLLDEIRNKQTALDNLVRLIDSRRSTLARTATAPTPLPPPDSLENSDDVSSVPGRKRFDSSRRMGKKKRATTREPRSVPLSGEPSRHGPQSQDSESTSRYRVSSAGAVALAPLELPSHGSVRDILFFTVN